MKRSLFIAASALVLTAALVVGYGLATDCPDTEGYVYCRLEY